MAATNPKTSKSGTPTAIEMHNGATLENVEVVGFDRAVEIKGHEGVSIDGLTAISDARGITAIKAQNLRNSSFRGVRTFGYDRSIDLGTGTNLHTEDVVAVAPQAVAAFFASANGKPHQEKKDDSSEHATKRRWWSSVSGQIIAGLFVLAVGGAVTLLWAMLGG